MIVGRQNVGQALLHQRPRAPPPQMGAGQGGGIDLDLGAGLSPIRHDGGTARLVALRMRDDGHHPGPRHLRQRRRGELRHDGEREFHQVVSRLRQREPPVAQRQHRHRLVEHDLEAERQPDLGRRAALEHFQRPGPLLDRVVPTGRNGARGQVRSEDYVGDTSFGKLREDPRRLFCRARSVIDVRQQVTVEIDQGSTRALRRPPLP